MIDSETGCGALPGTSANSSSANSSSVAKRSVDQEASVIPHRQRLVAKLKPQLKRIRSELREKKDLWTSSLPETMCQSVGAENGSGTCWNGEDSARFVITVALIK